jgi:hypothetical protein
VTVFLNRYDADDDLHHRTGDGQVDAVYDVDRLIAVLAGSVRGA